MAERVSFYSGKVETEFVTHPNELPTALDFLRSKPKKKMPDSQRPFLLTRREHNDHQYQPNVLITIYLGIILGLA